VNIEDIIGTYREIMLLKNSMTFANAERHYHNIIFLMVRGKIIQAESLRKD